MNMVLYLTINNKLLEYSYTKKLFFDTAPLYGFGRVEKIIGDFLIKKIEKNNYLQQMWDASS